MKKSLSLILLVAFASLVFTSCNKEQGAVTKTVDVTIAPNETYNYKFAPVGDADDQLEISTQAQHYTASTVVTDAATNASTFTYTPSENFTGTDVIIVKNEEHHQAKPSCGSTPPPAPMGHGNCQGGGGHKHHDDDITYIFKITVKSAVLPG